MYICMYERMYVSMYVHMYVCTYVCMYVCMYVLMYVCVTYVMYVFQTVTANHHAGYYIRSIFSLQCIIIVITQDSFQFFQR